MRAPSAALAALLLLGAPATGRAAGPDPLDTPVDFIRGLLGHERTESVRSHYTAIGPDDLILGFTLADNRTLFLELAGGNVRIGHDEVGHYQPHGPFHEAWRDLVHEAGRQSTPDLLTVLRDWSPDSVTESETPAADRVRRRLSHLAAIQTTAEAPQAVPDAGPGGLVVPLDDLSNPVLLENRLKRALALTGSSRVLTVPGGTARSGNFSLGSSETLTGPLLVLDGNADIYGIVNGNLVVAHGDAIVHQGGRVAGDVLAMDGLVRLEGGRVDGQVRTLAAAAHAPAATETVASSGPARVARNAAGLLGLFVTLAGVGFGVVLFGRSHLEIVADTVTHSFARSFVVGLLAEMLVLPTFGMLVVGLTLTVVGVLLIPFAVVAYGLLVIVGLLGGYLAVAHAMGETYTRRRMAAGIPVSSANSYRYLMIGLVALLALWAAWVVFGWVPVAGGLIKGIAALATWLLATTGFGAMLLSRAGAREAFSGRIVPPEALTDEYLWATPQFGVPAVRRPGHRTPPPGER